MRFCPPPLDRVKEHSSIYGALNYFQLGKALIFPMVRMFWGCLRKETKIADIIIGCFLINTFVEI